MNSTVCFRIYRGIFVCTYIYIKENLLKMSISFFVPLTGLISRLFTGRRFSISHFTIHCLLITALLLHVLPLHFEQERVIIMGVFLLEIANHPNEDLYFHPKDLGGSARLHSTFFQEIIYFLKYVVKKNIFCSVFS